MFKKIILSSLVISNALLAVEKPNVVIVYGDDVGYGDIAVSYTHLTLPTNREV